MGQISAWRRIWGILAAISVALAPLLLQPANAGATSSGTLFAVTGPNQSVLSRVDPVSGTITPIEDLAGPDQGQLVSITGDPATHRIFGFRTSFSFDPNGGFIVKSQVLTINSQTGSFSEGGLVSPPIGQILFDSSTNTLYGLGFNAVYVLDPSTGVATQLASLADVNTYILSMAVVPGAHTLYVNNFVQNFDGTATDQLLSINTQNGSISSGPNLADPVRIVAYDAALGKLFGITECCPREVVRIDPSSGTDTVVSAFNNSRDQSLQFAMAIDPASHTAYMDIESFINFTTTQDQIVSVNEQTGVFSFSPAISDIVWSQYFEPIVITAESIKADVRGALADGGIRSKGVATSLLAKLDAASAGRSAGRCSTAGQIYEAFINEVDQQESNSITAQAGAQLIGDAQYLIAHCP